MDKGLLENLTKTSFIKGRQDMTGKLLSFQKAIINNNLDRFGIIEALSNFIKNEVDVTGELLKEL